MSIETQFEEVRQTSKPQTLLFIQNSVGFLVIFVSVLNQQMTRIVIVFVILFKGKREKNYFDTRKR